MAQYLKQQSPATEALKDKMELISQMDLKNYGIIDVEQKEAYGNITLILTPLANAEF
ncbi:hypothetical protein Syun_008206 [Stephania yunnanensis]|uniref:Rad21/Rec8-like protein C-terminal eukaryotic domain-containing protein n=1 Tax=Stephania yunnanensis TaxID=152371 RepID=A0AAP0L2G5_9MAGN